MERRSAAAAMHTPEEDAAEEEGQPLVHTVKARTAAASSPPPPPPAAPKARWFTLEFLLYYLCMLIVYGPGSKLVWSASRSAEATPWRYRHLSSGWLGWAGLHHVDLADGQWRTLREHLPLLITLATAYLLLSHMVRRLAPAGVVRARARAVFYAASSVAFLLFVHGSSVAFMSAIVGVNFMIPRLLLARLPGASISRLATWLVTALTWLLTLVALVANERYGGYSWRAMFGWMAAGADSDSATASSSSLWQLLAWLDVQRGMMTHWHGSFNLVALRMVSWNLDWLWAAQAQAKVAAGAQAQGQGQGQGQEAGLDPELVAKHRRHCADCQAHAARANLAALGASGSSAASAAAGLAPCPWLREKASHALSNKGGCNHSDQRPPCVASMYS